MEMKAGGLNLHNVSLALTAGNKAQLLSGGLPQVALSGRSNVGKSSLVNCLLGRKKLARVSSEPGKTITINYYNVDGALLLVDLPGYGFACRPKEDKARWSSLTQAYFERNAALSGVLQLVDVRVGITDDDAQMLEWLGYYDIPYALVATKCDKLGKTALAQAAAGIISSPAVRPGTGCVLFSSLKGQGREAVWDAIIKFAFGEKRE